MSGQTMTEAEFAYLCAGVVMGCLSERAWPSGGEATLGPELAGLLRDVVARMEPCVTTTALRRVLDERVVLAEALANVVADLGLCNAQPLIEAREAAAARRDASTALYR